MSYDTDFYAWTQAQAEALRRLGRERINTPDAVDWENVAEEIESMGRSDKREIESRLDVLLQHLLKLAYSADTAPRSGWMETVDEQRDQLSRRLRESPSLRRYPKEILMEMYPAARRKAQRDASVRTLPPICPFDLDSQILNSDWFPDAPAGHSQAADPS